MSQLVPVRRVAVVGFVAAILCGLASTACDRRGRAASVEDETNPAATPPESTRKPCDDFAAKVCSWTASEFSTTCVDIKATVELLTPATCQLALESAPHSLEVLRRRPMDCDSLQAKLCFDVRSVPKSCDKVKRYTKNFPQARCKEMLTRYPDVLRDVKQGMNFL